VRSDHRYLVITADDFGRSSSINHAVELCCRWGVLTAASIVAGGEAFDEAVILAAHHPQLSVGLHVTLSGGSSVLPSAQIPGLVDLERRFEENPRIAGVRYWRLRETIAAQIEAEVEAQFGRVEEAGIRLTHVDCHHHLHMHPVLFPIIARQAAKRGITWIRLPREPVSLIAGHLRLLELKPLVKWLVFGLLADRGLRIAHSLGMRAVNNVLGLAGTGRINERYFSRCCRSSKRRPVRYTCTPIWILLKAGKK
jgi:predicted glycoside hydrolase/deacetylase ChbG (UPF0249 family)